MPILSDPSRVRADFSSSNPDSSYRDPCGEAWALGHDLGMDGLDVGPDPEMALDEAAAFRRGYAAGLDVGGWSLDIMYLTDRTLDPSEAIEAYGAVVARRAFAD